ncbi:RIP metalloprotease RseP [Metaclostridioides mangenotii]|uniref:RIP metalloprotease RseP n=1 Tax=Metaclostridioides mangenotii TaxID=1540 RepID=UPI0026F25BCF|nr:RIP metalloprotease RseP [Clostridioides mangenotii]
MTIIVALILFSIIIFIHELGHFLFAKLSGVKVHEFAIGMGPKVFSIKRGTEYSIRLLPLGGFVSMEGEDESSNDPDSFGNKSLLARLSTILAGPIFNLILAVIVLIPVFMSLGVPSKEAIVGELIKSGPAQMVGIETGDKILKINGKNVTSWEQTVKTVHGSGGKDLNVELERNGKTKEVTVTPEKKQGTYLIGMSPKMEKSIFGSITYSFETTVSMTKQMFAFLGQMITGTVPGGFSNSVAGPVGVIGMVSDAAKTGVINLLYLGSIISLNLGILNLLPIPALDGWRILMLIIEGIRGGKKFDPNKEGFLNLVGFGALMLFMIFITYKDVLRLFQ